MLGLAQLSVFDHDAIVGRKQAVIKNKGSDVCGEGRCRQTAQLVAYISAPRYENNEESGPGKRKLYPVVQNQDPMMQISWPIKYRPLIRVWCPNIIKICPKYINQLE